MVLVAFKTDGGRYNVWDFANTTTCVLFNIVATSYDHAVELAERKLFHK